MIPIRGLPSRTSFLTFPLRGKGQERETPVGEWVLASPP